MTAAPMLAAVVWPGLFYAGAGAISLPILIHLLARRRFRRIRWAAIEFLLQAERRNRRRVRLEELILLALRCLAILLIGLLVARPFIRPEGLAALLTGADRTERVFVFDDSFSMGYEREDGTSFDRAKRAVVQLVRLLREQSPNDTVTILRTSRLASPVAAGVFLDERQTEDLFARVEALTPSQQVMSVEETFHAVRRLLDEQPQTLSATVYMVSDFQRKDWSDLKGGGSADTATELGAVNPLSDWKSEDRGLHLVLADVGVDDARNVAVTALESPRARFVAGVNADLEAGLSNFTGGSVSADLEVTVGPVAQATVTVPEVPPNDTTTVSVPVTMIRPGWHWVRVSASRDALPIDDERSLVVHAVEALRILIVNGEPSSDTYRDEAALLRTAIRPPGEVFSGNELTVIDETELEETALDPFDVVMLANVYRVSPPAAQVLARFVSEGGGLAVFLGDQVDADLYNATLYADGRGLLPARLDERRTSPPPGARLTVEDALHPMVRIYAGTDNPFVQNVFFLQYYGCTPHGAGAGEGDDPGGQARVIARFNDEAATPAVIERSFGDGRVTLVTSSCDLEWNDWAKDPSYVVSLLELTQHLARGAGGATDQLVGSPVEVSIDPARYEAGARVRTPGYPAVAEVDVTATPDEQGRGFRIRWEQTAAAGVYRFVLTTRAGEEEVRAVAVNVDPSESDLTAATEGDLRQSLPELDFTYVAGLDSLGEIGGEARRELWRLVLAAVVVVLMGEQCLGWWFGRRA